MSKTTLTLILVPIVGLLLLLCVIFAAPFLNYTLLYRGLMAPSGRMKVWIKVVDQFGNSVKGYKLRILTTRPAITPFSKPRYGGVWAESDGNGMIYFDSKKKVAIVYFGIASHEYANKTPGYLPSRSGTAISYTELYSGNFEERREGAEDAMPDDPSHPIIVTVYKHGPPQKLLFFGEGGQQKILGEGDKYVSIDILEGKIWGSKEPEGDIAVREILKDEYQKLEPNESFGGYEFVAGKEAGIIQAQDNYHVECPEEGYKKMIIYPRDFRRGKWAVGEGIYFYCRNRKVYGYLEPFHVNYERGTCNIGYVANVNGNRCLYYDGYPDYPKEKLKPPLKMD